MGDASIDKEVDIRRRILKDFNRQREDFETLFDYNDYLEMIEDIIFNLTNNIDILETNKKIQAYKEQNKDQIIKNRSKHSRDALEIEDILAEEEKFSNQNRREMKVLEEAKKSAKLRNKEKLIDDLMFGEGDANKILSEHEEKVKLEETLTTTFSTGQKTGQALQAVEVVQEVPFVYEDLDLPMMGPDSLSESQLEDQGYINHIRAASETERAGGYVEMLGCLRAVREAMAGLYFIPGEMEPTNS